MDSKAASKLCRSFPEGTDLVVMQREVAKMLQRRQIGLSACSILWHLMGVETSVGQCSIPPRDVGDFNRCLNLLRKVPGLREKLPQMASISPEWAFAIEHWDELEGLVRGRSSDDTLVWILNPRDQ